eukprot:scaffold266780_cov21-Tisochrysis_lutea.AAC.1
MSSVCCASWAGPSHDSSPQTAAHYEVNVLSGHTAEACFVRLFLMALWMGIAQRRRWDHVQIEAALCALLLPPGEGQANSSGALPGRLWRLCLGRNALWNQNVAIIVTMRSWPLLRLWRLCPCVMALRFCAELCNLGRSRGRCSCGLCPISWTSVQSWPRCRSGLCAVMASVQS